jgi:hypothetical protein
MSAMTVFVSRELRNRSYDIGFLFRRDGKFKTGLEAFVAENRDHLLLDVAEFLPRQRDGWQEELKTLRNEYLEYRDEDVAAKVEKFYEPGLDRKSIRPCMADCR